MSESKSPSTLSLLALTLAQRNAQKSEPKQETPKTPKRVKGYEFLKVEIDAFNEHVESSMDDRLDYYKTLLNETVDKLSTADPKQLKRTRRDLEYAVKKLKRTQFDENDKKFSEGLIEHYEKTIETTHAEMEKQRERNAPSLSGALGTSIRWGQKTAGAAASMSGDILNMRSIFAGVVDNNPLAMAMYGLAGKGMNKAGDWLTKRAEKKKNERDVVSDGIELAEHKKMVRDRYEKSNEASTELKEAASELKEAAESGFTMEQELPASIMERELLAPTVERELPASERVDNRVDEVRSEKKAEQNERELDAHRDEVTDSYGVMIKHLASIDAKLGGGSFAKGGKKKKGGFFSELLKSLGIDGLLKGALALFGGSAVAGGVGGGIAGAISGAIVGAATKFGNLVAGTWKLASKAIGGAIGLAHKGVMAAAGLLGMGGGKPPVGGLPTASGKPGAKPVGMLSRAAGIGRFVGAAGAVIGAGIVGYMIGSELWEMIPEEWKIAAYDAVDWSIKEMGKAWTWLTNLFTFENLQKAFDGFTGIFAEDGLVGRAFGGLTSLFMPSGAIFEFFAAGGVVGMLFRSFGVTMESFKPIVEGFNKVVTALYDWMTDLEGWGEWFSGWSSWWGGDGEKPKTTTRGERARERERERERERAAASAGTSTSVPLEDPTKKEDPEVEYETVWVPVDPDDPMYAAGRRRRLVKRPIEKPSELEPVAAPAPAIEPEIKREDPITIVESIEPELIGPTVPDGFVREEKKPEAVPVEVEEPKTIEEPEPLKIDDEESVMVRAERTPEEMKRERDMDEELEKHRKEEVDYFGFVRLKLDEIKENLDKMIKQNQSLAEMDGSVVMDTEGVFRAVGDIGGGFARGGGSTEVDTPRGGGGGSTEVDTPRGGSGGGGSSYSGALSPSVEEYAAHLEGNSRVRSTAELLPRMRSFLDLIHRHESNLDNGDEDGYNTVYGGGVDNLTSMTIAEVLRKQEAEIAAGAGSVAKGRYQFTYDPLKEVTEWLGIDPETTLFDEKTQDMLAVARMRNPALRKLDDFLAGKITEDEFIDRAAMEWAGLVNTKKVGHYDGDALGNKATSNLEETRMILGEIKENIDKPLETRAPSTTPVSFDPSGIDKDLIPESVLDTRIKTTDGSTKTLAELGITRFSELQGKGGQAFAGGFNDESVLYSAALMQEYMPGFDRVTGQNDLFHQRRHRDGGPYSKHQEGSKIDFTIGSRGDEVEYTKEAYNNLIAAFERMGLSEGDYTVHTDGSGIRGYDYGDNEHIDYGITESGREKLRQRMLEEQAREQLALESTSEPMSAPLETHAMMPPPAPIIVPMAAPSEPTGSGMVAARSPSKAGAESGSHLSGSTRNSDPALSFYHTRLFFDSLFT